MTPVDVVCPFCQGTKTRRFPTGRIISDLITEKPEMELRSCPECKATGIYAATPIVEPKPVEGAQYRGSANTANFD